MFIPPWEIVTLLDPAFPPRAARVFLVMALPVWLYASWYDMARLKILNGLVLLVFGIFVAVGPVVMPLDVYLWQLVQAVVVLLVVLLFYGAGTMGGGDA
ncbi:MAG: prepilin peptidase, partial [Bacteroidota bacterium]